ncbi:TonB-dependent receptor [Aestuariibacter sp. AA17]|uniref:TonB-dependent receptor n=1 Tax=Fluctibacter corallii TaxID=2984329 RepID=A0ABT3AA60_9ALTE|nr:TonB-dependent receptor [Aestuariibacter sp. AA17]MCV2885563.1 TonB-dependent receptor [Aestuariibacter sp. AA17]
MKYSLLATLITGLVTTGATAQTPDSANLERISVLGARNDMSSIAGSVALIDETELEKFEYDDIARILATVPGVNIRQEDGYGLRPNIGFRGVTPERSKKINIMEDGVLIGPAPYSAPAAYYFPMTSRMTAIEVTKGPSTIKYGPNTVAGALNLVTRPVPVSSEGGIDVALGGDGYQKAHSFYGNTIGQTGFLFEGLHLSADGFKTLDTGGDTGFEKTDLMAKFNHEFATGNVNHLLELKLGYTEETSDETYLGLTDSDFRESPYRRYAASQLDKMDWEHTQALFTYHLEADAFNLTTRVYRNDFERAWFKVNGFASSLGATPTLQAILNAPDSDAYNRYYNVLTGATDSTLQEIIVLGNNDREYYSQGIQIDGEYRFTLMNLAHRFEAGVRFHEDEIQRNHTEQRFFMRSSELVNTGEGITPTSTNTEQSETVSVYLQDTVDLGAILLTAGVRGEFIDSDYQNRTTGFEQDYQRKSYRIWLPSISAYYRLDANSGIFGGVHKGFVPTSPIQDAALEAEKSTNYELGYRYANNGTQAEIVGFYSDYSNLKESCSNSAGCDTDEEFNAGEVDIYGLEVSAGQRYTLSDSLTMPVHLSYTYTDSEFNQTFYSDFEQWGFVNNGDAVPYLAEHMASLSVGLEGQNWLVSAILSYSGAMPEAAQTALTGDARDATLAGVETDSYTTLDLTANYQLSARSEVYAKADNLLDDESIVSRRPYGARPNKPRQFVVGYKYRF